MPLNKDYKAFMLDQLSGFGAIEIIEDRGQ
jgi:hypothetical protein